MVSPIVLYGRPTTDALTRAAALQLDEARLTYRVCDLRYTMCLREVAELLQTSSFSVPVLQVGRLRVYPYTQSALAAAIRSYNP